MPNSNSWVSTEYQTLLVTGGSETSNPDLVNELTDNATAVQSAVGVDVTSLGLSAGTHTLTAKARASGYRDSALSNSISITLYAITGTASHALISGVSSYSGTVTSAGRTFTLTADSGYKLPQTVTVSGATSTYTRTSDVAGTLVISAVAGPVTFSVTAEVLTYTITPTLTRVTADSSNPSTINANTSATLIYTTDSGYIMPDDVTITGATKTSWTVINVYEITATCTNVTASSSNPTTVDAGGSATLVFTADGTNYKIPATAPTVTGATGTWVKNSDTQGTMVLTNPTADISFTVVGEQGWEYPVQEGDVLTITQAYLATQTNNILEVE